MTNNKEKDDLEWTGERYLPKIIGDIEVEHLHRYAVACMAAAGKVVLDIASGEGYGTSMLAKVAKNVIGVDISEESIIHAAANYARENIEFRVGSCDNIPVENSSVDLIVSFETIEHHDQHESMLNEFKRVLKQDDGVLIISSPDKQEYSDNTGYNNPYHVKELYKEEFKKLISNNFKYTQIYGQRIIYGSGIFIENDFGLTCNFNKSDSKLTAKTILDRSIYNIIVASNHLLPKALNGVLEQPVSDGGPFIAEIDTKEKKILELTKTGNECNAKNNILENKLHTLKNALADLDEIILSKEVLIGSVNQVTKQKEKKISSLNAIVENCAHHIKLQDDTIKEKDLIAKENLEKYLAVINCTTWRVATRLTNIVRSLPLSGYLFTLTKKSIYQAGAWREFFLKSTSSRKKPIEDIATTGNNEKKLAYIKNGQNNICVSVIIPTYNRSPLIPSLLACWREVHKNTSYSYELIFSDDGSNDNTIELLKQEKELPLIIVENQHGGVSKARNRAIKIAKGEKLIIVGDDIYPNPLFINQHYQQLRRLDKNKAVLGLTLWHNKILKSHLMKHITDIGCEQFSYPNLPLFDYTDCRHFYTCNISIDREFLLSESIIFDDRFYTYGFEDVELGYRLEQKGMQVFYNPSIQAFHYHEYHQVENFCKRQLNAGEMAVVFSTMHQNIEWITRVEKCVNKYMDFISFLAKHEILINFTIISPTIGLCQVAEESLFLRNNKELGERLSVVYKGLFQFFYEEGVLDKKCTDYGKLREMYFYHEYLQDQKMRVAIIEIAQYCDNLSPEEQNKLAEVIPFELKKKNLTIWFKDKLEAGKLVALPYEANHKVLNIIVNNNSDLDDLREKYARINKYIVFSIKDERNGISLNPAVEFCYAPNCSYNSLNINQLRQVILFLHLYGNAVDFILVSSSLEAFPVVAISGIDNNTIFSSNYSSVTKLFASNSLNGKVVRLLSGMNEENNNNVDLQSCFDFPCSCTDNGFVTIGSNALQTTLPCACDKLAICPHNKTKKLVFVLPILLAVGGVERNTVEIMASLADEYEFVVITMETLLPKQGSLHHQFLEHSLAVYDLAELSAHESYVSLLKILKNEYLPDLVWICNGSPWLESNTINIRRLFFDTPIVDQQAYDTEAGWISLYRKRNKGLMLFDRFIAINSKICTVMLTEAQVDRSQVDLIYSVISTEKRGKALAQSLPDLYKKFNLNHNKVYFTFIGRMSAQKAPLDLISLIKKIKSKYDDKYNFVIVGDGELYDDVENAIAEADLTNIIIQIKYIENTFELHRISNGIIFTSLYEGLPIAMLEALSVGTPVISTDTGDIKKVVEAYNAGVVFEDFSDIDLYFDNFCEFVKIYEQLSNKLQEISNDIAYEFSPENIAQSYSSTFNKAMLPYLA